MSGNILNQRYVYKIKSDYIDRNGGKLEFKDMSNAIKNRYIVSLGSSTGIRIIEKMINTNDKEKKINAIKREIKSLKRTKDLDKKELKKLIKEKNTEKIKLMHEDSICNVIFKSKSQYKKYSKKGFYINGEKYVILLGTSGGIKKNTVMFVKEKLYQKVWESLIADANLNIPMIPSKLMGYMSLTFSASTPVTFTDKILVVKDVETNFKSDVTRIFEENGEVKVVPTKDYNITLNACDGCGMITPKLAEIWGKDLKEDYLIPGFCIRNLWVKGMVTVFDFKKYCNEVLHMTKVKDVWGEEHDINDIDIILNESMLKCWMMYGSLQEYLNAVKKYNYEFAVTKYVHKNIEKRRKLNYQYTQCLNLSDEDIEELLREDMNEIKDVLGLDYRKSILFSKGTELNDENVWIDSEDDYYTKALMIYPQCIYDDYIKDKIKRAINKRINLLKTSKISVNGNYQIAVGEPIIQLESMFDLEPKGLLNANEFYIEYWRELGESTVGIFRSPMSCKENALKVNVCNREEVIKWYGHLRGLIVFNAWDTAMVAMNGEDFDGDLNFTTNNKIIQKGIYNLPAISCDGKSANKISNATREQFNDCIFGGFGNKVGSVTNVGSSLYDTLSVLDKGTKEYDEIDNRIKKIQWYQQECIDSAKNGVPPKPLPSEWTNYKSCEIKIDMETGEVLDSLETVDLKNFNRSILTEKKPYFFRYIYSETNKEYVDFLNKSNINSLRRFRLTVDEIRLKKDKTDEEKEFLQYFEKKIPLSNNPCVVNKIAAVVEKNFSDNIVSPKGAFDYKVYCNQEYNQEYDNTVYSKIKLLYKDYIRYIKSEKDFKDKDEISIFNELALEYFRTELDKLLPNEEDQCETLLYLSYEKSYIQKSFVWNLIGNKIIKNMLKNANYKISYPIKDENGDIRYGGEYFKMVSKEVIVSE